MSNTSNTYVVPFVNGRTYVAAYPKLSRVGHEVVYMTRTFYNDGDSKGVAGYSGFFSDMQRRFKAVRNNFATEEEFLKHLGVDKSKMGVY